MLQLVYYGYVTGSLVARWLPERLAYRLAEGAGKFASRRSKRRGIVERNLSRVTGLPPGSRALDHLVEQAYCSYARYWLETFRLVREGKEFFLERFRAIGEEHIDEVIARGKGAIVVVGHLGNWDAAGAWVGATGRRLVTVVEVLRPRRMFEFFKEHRERLGMKIYGAEPGVTARLAEDVEQGAVIAILGDRDLKGTGVEVDFFGEKATMPPGAAALALRTNVPLLVAGVYGMRFEDGRHGWLADISEPIELPARREDAVPELTREVARHLEKLIARRPEEWHVFQPFWPADRSEDAR